MVRVYFDSFRPESRKFKKHIFVIPSECSWRARLLGQVMCHYWQLDIWDVFGKEVWVKDKNHPQDPREKMVWLGGWSYVSGRRMTFAELQWQQKQLFIEYFACARNKLRGSLCLSPEQDKAVAAQKVTCQVSTALRVEFYLELDCLSWNPSSSSQCWASLAEWGDQCSISLNIPSNSEAWRLLLLFCRWGNRFLGDLAVSEATSSISGRVRMPSWVSFQVQ